MESEPDKIFLEDFVNGAKSYIIYKDLFIPSNYELIADALKNFEVRDDDVWVCTFPKAGTTWTQEMIWNISNDLDFEGAKVPIAQRFPFLELCGMNVTVCLRNLENIGNLPSPRFIKTHLPFHLLPWQLRTQKKNSKIIYVTRNPKDTCISYYHHYKLLEGYCGTLENFSELFLTNKVMYAPYWEHINGYWENKESRNISCIKYEDMKKDLQSIIRKSAAFLGKKLSDNQVHDLERHLSFSSMKKNSAVNYQDLVEELNGNKIGENVACQKEFIRQGTVGQWKTAMSNELIEQFNNCIADGLKHYPHLRHEFYKI